MLKASGSASCSQVLFPVPRGPKRKNDLPGRLSSRCMFSCITIAYFHFCCNIAMEYYINNVIMSIRHIVEQVIHQYLDSSDLHNGLIYRCCSGDKGSSLHSPPCRKY